MAYTYFTESQFLPLALTSVILIISIVTYSFDKKRVALALLFFSSIGFGFFTANLDHFLILWDEQYHALVAKHMLDNPFRPTLYAKPLLEYDYHNWTANHIWVHKQPLFLWQMALSLKIFGISALSVRIPSVILHAFTTLFIYRIGKISFSENAGYYGALFFSVAYYPLEMVAGKFPTDHNDLVFTCYVTASFWAWFEYAFSRKKFWLIGIGFFSGCALLVKWLPGLLVYAAWFISLVMGKKEKGLGLKSFSHILIAGSITLIIAIPWQLYIFNKFPEEATSVYMHNMRHFTEALDGHSGSAWFHFNAFRDIYGSGILIPVFYLAGLFLLIIKSQRREFGIVILSAVILTYLFYSLAETKMTAFCLIVSPFFFLGLGALVDWLLQKINNNPEFKLLKKLSVITLLVILCGFLLNLKKIHNYHTDWNPLDNCNRQADLQQMEMIKKLSDNLPGDSCVVFNAAMRLNGHIPIMFYTDFIAYDFIPDVRQIEKIKNQSYKIAILDNDSLPDFIRQDNDIIKVRLH